MTEVLVPPTAQFQRGEPTNRGESHLPTHWWVQGLALAERAALPAWPDVATVSARGQRRLERWKKKFDLAESGQFARRLDALGLTEEQLLVLLSEERAELADRAGPPPRWAELTEAVLEHMPQSTIVQVPDLPEEQTWQAGLTMVVAPFIRFAAEQLVNAVRAEGHDLHTDIHALRGSFVTALTSTLVTLASRTLVLELNVLRVTDRLTGDTPQQRFWSFVEHFSQRAEFAALLTEYPVLGRLLAQAVGYGLDAWLELLRRFTADRDALVEQLFGGVDPGVVVEVAGDRGDTHQRGRAVALLRFANGMQVVYKPRSQAAHVHFNSGVEWLNARMPSLDLRTLTVLERDGYGWVEYAEHLPCTDRSALHRYYHRQGALLGLLYALDGADFHFENLIASGDQPVLVDLEALLHPRMEQPGHALYSDDPAAVALQGSVTKVGLLPSLVFGENGTVLDMGGAGGDAGATMPFTAAGWESAGTDQMRLIRQNPTFPGSKNRPRLAGEDADPSEFANDLAKGFRAAYETIRHGREEFASDVLSRFRGVELRVVARATRVYGSLMLESTHPDVMRDALDRDRILDLLWAISRDDPARERLVISEQADMWQGDVPLLAVYPESRDVWTTNGERFPDMLATTSLAEAAEKLQQLGPRDRETQEWIIEASFASRMASTDGLILPDVAGEDETVAAPGTPTPTDRQRALDAARAIGNRLIDSAYRDGTRVGWLGMTFVNESRWQVQPISYDIYSGYSGVALFLSQLADITGEQRYADLARDAIAPVQTFAEELSGVTLKMFSASAFGGFAGAAYALVHVAANLNEPELLTPVEQLLTLITPTAELDTLYDVIGGCAGGVVAALAIHEATGSTAALDLAKACADRLIETAHPQPGGVAWESSIESTQPLAGFSHGAAGIGWALLRYAAATGERAAAETGLAAFSYERNAYRADIGNWPDFRVVGGRPPVVDEPAMHAWCHGSPGIGLARVDSRHLDHPQVAADLDRALQSMIAAGPQSSHSLCHGQLGNLELLTLAMTNKPNLTAVRAHWGAAALDLLARSGPICGTPGGVATPGLMSGLAGIGHGLLRFAEPDRVPSALLLHAPRSRSC